MTLPSKVIFPLLYQNFDWVSFPIEQRLQVDGMGAPPRALLLELACNLLERGPIRWHAVPARADDVHELVVGETGWWERGPHVLIWSNNEEGGGYHHHCRENTEKLRERIPTQHKVSDSVVVHERPR